MTRRWLVVAVLVPTVGISYLIAVWTSHSDSPAMAPADVRVVTVSPLRDVAALPVDRVVHRRPDRAPRRRAHARRHRVARVVAARAVRTPAMPVPRMAPVATVPSPRPVPTVTRPAPARQTPTPAAGFDSSGRFDSSG